MIKYFLDSWFLLLVLFRTEKVLKVWQKTVFDHPDSPALWKAYLTFFQSNFSSFTISALRTLYEQAVKILLKSKALYKIGTDLSKNIGILISGEREGKVGECKPITKGCF
jgi:hypothetical protein